MSDKLLQKAVISYLEVYADDNMDLENNRNEYAFNLRQYYRCKNNLGQNVLHIIAKKCSRRSLTFILDVLETKEVQRIVNELDDEGNSPLMVASLFGSQELSLDSEEERTAFWEKRSGFFTDLVELAAADVSAGVTGRQMNPLHWAFYFGDINTGLLLFRRCPKLLFMINEDGQTPLEIGSQLVFRPEFKRKSIALARACIHHLLDELARAGGETATYLARGQFSTQELQDLLVPAERGSIRRLFGKKNRTQNSRSGEFDAPNEKAPLRSSPPASGEFRSRPASAKGSDFVGEKPKVTVIDARSKRHVENELVRILNIFMCVEVYAYSFLKKGLAENERTEGAVEQILDLIRTFGINPFVRSLENKSPFEHAIVLNLCSLIDEFSRFEYVNKYGRRLDVKLILNSKNELGETALHLAAFKNSKEVYDKLIAEFKLEPVYNNFYLLPEENTQDKKFVGNRITYFNDTTELNKLDCPDKILEYLSKNLKHEDFDSPYAIGFVFNSERDAELVRSQWASLDPVNLSSWYDENAEDGRESLVFINHAYDKYPMVAQNIRLSMFNKEKGYMDVFEKEEMRNFTKFRDFHKHKLLLYLLNLEVDIDVYIANGIIENMVFLHDLNVRKKLRESWYKERWYCLLDPLFRPRASKISWPFAGIAFYFGADYGLVLSFISLYTAYLFLLMLIALFFTFWVFRTQGDYDNSSSPIFGIIISLWMSVMVQMWLRRESECAMVWRTMNVAKNELDLPSFRGNVSVDSRTKLIQKKDPIDLQTRQFITLVPVYLIGFCLIAINFYVFTELSNLVDSSELDDTTKLVIGSLIGVVNGIANNLFQWVFELVIEKAVDFENHQKNSTKEQSILLKMFVYNFILNYVNSFYYLFFEENFSVFSVNYISTVISNDIYYFFEQRLIPWMVYLGKQRKLVGDLESTRREEVEEYFKKIGRAAKSKNSNFKAKPISEFLNELLVQEQLQINLIMLDSPDTKDIMFQYTAQLGYIAFFSLSFPPAVVWCAAFNVVDLLFTTWAFVDHTKRKQCLEISTLGFWNTALSAMCFIAVAFNAVVLMFGSNSCYELMGISSDNEAEKWKLIVALFTAENVLFVAKFLIFTLIDEKPAWVREKMKQEELLYERDVNVQLKKNNKNFNNAALSLLPAQAANPTQEDNDPLLKLPNADITDDHRFEDANDNN